MPERGGLRDRMGAPAVASGLRGAAAVMARMRGAARVLAGLALAAGLACAGTPPPDPATPTPAVEDAVAPRAAPGVLPAPMIVPEPRHGVVVGDVSAREALVWSRAEGATRMEVLVQSEAGGVARRESAPVEATRDHTARLLLTGLAPDTRHRYVVRLLNEGPGARLASRPLTGVFRTAPESHAAAPVRLAFGGDVAGQNVCRDVERGFPVFRVLHDRGPDVFVALGDMIYADDRCRSQGLYGNPQLPGDFGPAVDREGFWAHWRYAREDAGLQAFFAATSSVAVWDDHEVRNDFGPRRDTPGVVADPPEAVMEPPPRLMPLGLAAFLDYNPVAVAEAEGSTRLYRRLRWGRHLELFVLDTRQYRAPNDRPDTAPLPKTMLGAAQREWLLLGLAGSDATWKVVVSSVPISVPTGSRPETEGRDGWADHDGDTGFERELRDILRTTQQNGVRNQLWITTDIHFASVLRYTPFDDRPSFRFHEIATGPLHAAVVPRTELDPSLGPERLFLHGPDDPRAVAGFAEALRWFNFGELDIDAAGLLTARVVNALGDVVWETQLTPE